MSIDCLRLSLTDKCNLRCVYCHPLPGFSLIKGEFVSRVVSRASSPRFEEILRIVRLVRELAAIAGIEELSATTNGVFLESLAEELKAAGLQRVNISVDSIERETYERITGFDLLTGVIDGIYKAIDAGLTPVKINSVIIKGLNDSEEQITALADMSVDLPLSVTIIRQYGSDVGVLLRQRKYECASFADFGFHADTAPVDLDDLFHNRKPNAGILNSIAWRKGLE